MQTAAACLEWSQPRLTPPISSSVQLALSLPSCLHKGGVCAFPQGELTGLMVHSNM